MEHGRWEDMLMDCLVNIFSRIGLDDLVTSVPFVCKSWYEASADPINLRVLDFRRLDFNPSSISFSRFLKLALSRSHGVAVDLSFSPLSPISKEDLSLVSDECSKLKNLSLSRIELEDEAQLLQAIGKWEELEVLEMDSKPSNLPDIVKQIGLHCTNFQGLKLRGSVKKDDAEAIVGFLPNLKWLDLSTCRLGREEVFAIIEGCRDLKRLSVRECVGFEADEEMKRRGSWIKVFEHEGSVVQDKCELEDDRDFSLEQMLMYYDDCYAMWLY